METKKLNIIVRTANRPLHFQKCIESILQQTYKDITIWVGIERDNLKTINYVAETKGNFTIAIYDKITIEVNNPEGVRSNYGAWFPYNSYLNIIGIHIKDGYVMYLDDDDMFTYDTSAETIMASIKNEHDLLFWRVQFPNLLIPRDATWKDMKYGCPPVKYEISGIGFAFHSKFLPRIDWGYWKLADYRVAKQLYFLCDKKICIDKVLTSLQAKPNNGNPFE